MRPTLAAIVTLLVLSCLPAPARADHPPIVLESYVGEKPADADAILAPLVDELAKHRFVIGAAVVGRKFESTASRPAVGGGLPADFAEAVTRGYELWTNGKFDEAATVLGELVERARRSSGELAGNQNRALHGKLQEAMIALALSQLKQGDRSAARQTMAEALRGDPELKITRGMYGQDASELWNEVRRELTERGPGKLIVTVGATGAGIYVNERLVEMGSGLELGLFPGEYRVVARIGDEVSRAHKVTVVAGGTHRLTIDPAFDRAVHTGPDWTGFRYATSAERERDELRHAAAFATAIDARQVILVGIDTVRGRRMLRGVLVNKVNDRDLLNGSIPLDASPSEERRRNLARFLNGAPPTPDIIVVRAESQGPDGSGGAAGDDRPGSGAPWGGWKWVAGGAAVAAGVAGGVLLAYDGRCSAALPTPDAPCPNNYQTATQGWLAVGGAAALAGVTVFLVVKERRAGAPGRTAYVVPTAGGAFAGYAARF